MLKFFLVNFILMLITFLTGCSFGISVDPLSPKILNGVWAAEQNNNIFIYNTNGKYCLNIYRSDDIHPKIQRIEKERYKILFKNGQYSVHYQYTTPIVKKDLKSYILDGSSYLMFNMFLDKGYVRKLSESEGKKLIKSLNINVEDIKKLPIIEKRHPRIEIDDENYPKFFDTITDTESKE